MIYVLHKYEDVRKGIEVTGWVAYVGCFLLFAGYTWLATGSVEQASFWTAEWVIAGIRASWILLFVCAYAALVLGSLAWRLEKDSARKARARAAVRTSQFALVVPALLFLLITSMIWAGMFRLAHLVREPFFSSDMITKTLPGGAWLQSHQLLLPDPRCTLVDGDYFRSALAWSVGYQLPVTLALFGAALFLLAWWALPAALTERFPLRGQDKPPRSSTNAESAEWARGIPVAWMPHHP